MIMTKRNINILLIAICNFIQIIAVQYRVAFVFAGSPRSFVDPIVYLSIKNNLVQGFCPPSICKSHVFARFSFSDNSHDIVRYSAKGVLLPRSNRDRDTTLTAVRTLSESVTYDEVDIGSQVEQDDMHQLNNSNHPLHILYRDLDPRRYSMYFNRWSAYQMAVRQEQSSGVKFDWIVHARLDFFFGEPVRPVSLWSQDRIWLVDQWSYDVPDVFALLPRQFSDRFYSLDDLYLNPKAICLGGPDFDQSSITKDALIARGYSDSMQNLVQKEWCHQKFPGNLAFDRKTQVQWSIQGASETILRRKLASLGITRFAKLGYSTFFTIMVRHPIMFNCLNTRPNSHIGWLNGVFLPTSAMSHGCYSIQYDLKYLMAHKSSTASRYGANCDMTKITSKSGAAQVDSFQSACLLDETITHWNFMPFQITLTASGLHCLTVGTIQNAISQSFPQFTECKKSETDNRKTALYSVPQLFHFYPASSAPQRITNFQIYTEQRNCLTIIPRKGVNKLLSGQPSEHSAATPFADHHNNTKDDDLVVVFTRCAKSPQINQMFRVIPSTKTTATPIDLMNAEEGSMPLSGRVMESEAVVVLRWVGMNEQYCISIDNSANNNNNADIEWKRLVLQMCNNGTMTRFFAQRTKNTSPTQTLPGT